MKLIYVLSLTLIVNAFLATSLNLKRPKRNLLWVKNMVANLFGYKRPHANHRVMYTIPEYLIFQPATIAPQYMTQNIYPGPLTKILIPCYMQNQPFITFEQQNIPVYIYNTDECNYRPILNSDYFNINGPQYSPYPLKYYDQIQNPEAIRGDKQTYSRNMEPLQEKFNENLSHCTEEAKPTVPKIQNYQDEEQIKNKVGSTKAPELTVTKNNLASLSSSTTSAISTTSVTTETSVTPITSATFAPTTISAISTTSATSTTLVASTTLLASTTSTSFTNSATSTISAADAPYDTSTISTTSDTSSISATSIENLAFTTFSTLDQNSIQTPPVTTTDTTSPSANDSATTTFSTSTLTTMATPIVNTIDTLPASEITVTPESSTIMQLFNSSTDSSSSTSVSFQTTTSTLPTQPDSPSITEQGEAKDVPIFTNSLETTTLSNIVPNESDFKNATNGTTNPLRVTELKDQLSTASLLHSRENNNTEESTIAAPLNFVQESNFPLGKSEEGLLPQEKKENSRGDIPDMTT
ncbi:unnamed protein product [Danaus chrysippus]|uniref:(African queen) hypothetical protein n=1 Tax=Danaus chrysippus TaxID=151541 RepID=A0A8J2VTS2_9NEOP|nr:unnamed protein product [Danaus chrysippus]